MSGRAALLVGMLLLSACRPVSSAASPTPEPVRCECTGTLPDSTGTARYPDRPRTTAYVFLVDRTTSYSHIGHDLMERAQGYIAQLLPAAQPGDIFFGSWISGSSSFFYDTFLDQKQITVEPHLPLPVMPTALPSPRTQIDCPVHCADRPRYAADLKRFQDDTLATIKRWSEKQETARVRDTGAIKVELQKMVFALDPREPQVIEGLNKAAQVFDSARRLSPGARMRLVIFSGLVAPVPKDPGFRLEGVEVVVALYHRHGIEYEEAGKREWGAALRALGARDVQFYTVEATTPAVITGQ